MTSTEPQAAITGFVREYPRLRGLVMAPFWAAMLSWDVARILGWSKAGGGLDTWHIVVLIAGVAGCFAINRYYRRRFGVVKADRRIPAEAPGATPVVARHLASALVFLGLVLGFADRRFRWNAWILTLGFGMVLQGARGAHVRWYWIVAGGLVLIAGLIPFGALRFVPLGVVSLSCLVAGVVDHFVLVRRFDEVRAVASAGLHGI